MKTKHSKRARNGNVLTRLSAHLDKLDNKQVKRIGRTRKRAALEEQAPGTLLIVVIIAVLLLPSFTNLGPALTLFILIMFWPLTIPATIAIIVLARKKMYREATGVVLGVTILCTFAILVTGI